MLLVCSGVLLVVLGLGAWLAVDGLRARDELLAGAGLVTTLQDHVVNGDRDAAATTLAELQDHAEAAQARTHGPHWSIAEALPWFGDDVRAVQTVAEVVDSLATDALPGLMDATELVDPARLAPTDGRVDLAPLQAAAPVVVAADATVQDALERVTAIDTEGLVSAVGGPVEQLATQVQQVAMTTATAARAVQLLPPMLGADGPRDYLLLVQNNAEPRALGGIPGAVILLRADAGAVELVELRNASGPLGSLPEPALPVSNVERFLLGDQLGRYMADVTFTPDFPRAAEMAKAIWEQQIGGAVSGVVSLDTGALAAVLGSTGSVPIPPGAVQDAVGPELTAENAVEVLNNTVYRLVEDTVEQDAFYAATGKAVFDAALAGEGSPAATITALAGAADRGQLTVWSAREKEQARLAGTVLSGELRGVRDGDPVLGLFLNDGTGSKIGYYLRTEVRVSPGECAVDGTRLIAMDVTFTSTAPPEVVDMPPYISGGRVLEPGRMRFNALAYAPSDGYIEDAVASDGTTGGASHVHDGLSVLARTIELAPGESMGMKYRFRTGPSQNGRPVVRMTPLIDQQVNVDDGWRCS
ncbi:DUF4012 domain-containing protein [Cellulomonas sp. 179-A 9B4 NHS]|uniref:DUF4012 domain-containing protein n=1 Tax=Cellulomonas sp. 179-A 9B4 NHS TaxID=3142379 RepID=UPI00399FD8A5